MSGNLPNKSSYISKSPYKMTNPYHNYIQKHSPIKRTLSSIDMLCPKSLLDNNKMTRTQSSNDFSKLQRRDDYIEIDTKKIAFDDIWSSIQADKNNLNGSGSGSGSGQGDPQPYIHPLVKRSTSSLSEKSLEICTESLGSETGSDGFSHPVLDPEEFDHEEEVGEVELLSKNNTYNNDNVVVEDVNFGVSKTGPLCLGQGPINNLGRSPINDLGLRPKSFPPPLSSLAQRDGSNIHMRSHRQHGRLVLEAVSVPSNNFFRAHRQDGRLLLTLVDDLFEDDPFNGEEEVVEESKGEENEEEKIFEYEDTMSKNEENANSNKLMVDTFIMCKVIRGLPSYRNSSIWPLTIKVAVVKTLDNRKKVRKEKKLFKGPIKSDRPILSTATAKSDSIINTYEYYWRQSTAVAVLKSLVRKQIIDNKAISIAPEEVERKREKEINKLVLSHKGKSMSLIQQGVVLVKAERVGASSTIGERVAHDEYLVPLLRGCKEHRMKSFLLLDSYCIVTT